jgi:hypothetical protein
VIVLKLGVKDALEFDHFQTYFFSTYPPILLVVVAVVHAQLLFYKTRYHLQFTSRGPSPCPTGATRAEDSLIPVQEGISIRAEPETSHDIPFVEFFLLRDIFRTAFFLGHLA